MSPRFLISVSGDGVSVLAVDANGQCNGTGLNEPGQTLRSVIRKYDGHPNLVLVHDAQFGTGYHTITQACSAGGHGWCYRLTPYYPESESSAAHEAMVAAAKAGRPVGKSGLTIAFDRLEADRRATLDRAALQARIHLEDKTVYAAFDGERHAWTLDHGHDDIMVRRWDSAVLALRNRFPYAKIEYPAAVGV